MCLPAILTGKQVVSAIAATAFTHRFNHLEVRFGDTIAEALRVPHGMVTEYLLNAVHDSTPRTSWLSFSRERASPSSVTCR